MTRIEEERIDETALVNYLWQEFCELPDRSSPDEYPDMALVSLSELTAIVETYFERSPELKELRAQGGVRVTDEMVERACEAYVVARYDGGVVWPEHFSRDEVRDGRYNMTKALTAALSPESKP